MFGSNIVSHAENVFIGLSTLDKTSGAFKIVSTQGSRSANNSGNSGYCTVDFDPSLASTEYVTGANLQVSALQVLCCIKV